MLEELRDHVAKKIGADREAGEHRLHARAAEDAQRQDHAPPAARRGREPAARRHDDARRPGGRRRRSRSAPRPRRPRSSGSTLAERTLERRQSASTCRNVVWARAARRGRPRWPRPRRRADRRAASTSTRHRAAPRADGDAQTTTTDYRPSSARSRSVRTSGRGVSIAPVDALCWSSRRVELDRRHSRRPRADRRWTLHRGRAQDRASAHAVACAAPRSGSGLGRRGRRSHAGLARRPRSRPRSDACDRGGPPIGDPGGPAMLRVTCASCSPRTETRRSPRLREPVLPQTLSDIALDVRREGAPLARVAAGRRFAGTSSSGVSRGRESADCSTRLDDRISTDGVAPRCASDRIAARPRPTGTPGRSPASGPTGRRSRDVAGPMLAIGGAQATRSGTRPACRLGRRSRPRRTAARRASRRDQRAATVCSAPSARVGRASTSSAGTYESSTARSTALRAHADSPSARPSADAGLGAAASRSASASSNGPISARWSAVGVDHVLRDALHVLGGDRVEPGEHLLRLEHRRPRAPRGARPNMIIPCGLSSWRTKRPLAKLRAFSSSSAGTGSVGDPPELARRSSSTASSMRVDVDAGLRVERAGVGVAVVVAEDVVGEAAPLAHLGEEARRHAAAEHGREQLQRVAVGMVERVAADAEAEVRLVGLLRVDLHLRAVPCADGDRVGRAGRRRLEVAEQLARARSSEVVADPPADADDHPRRPCTSGRGSRGTSRASRRGPSPCGR